ncbi:50S ribosomal protein L24 [Candidatus Pelagibacter communis]|uniref:50S ribosomal protein L24 n=1 Tax=Pelagibacter ubique TaxID=198252 RepID=UPI00094C0B21|nr:50S ribosomal protein L24 [Candidatus Pelagibacter ubique]
MITKGINVKILTGKDKNKTGEIIEVDRNNNRVKIKGANMIKKHVKTTKDKKGGIFEKENFIHISNISILKNEKKKNQINKNDTKIKRTL